METDTLTFLEDAKFTKITGKIRRAAEKLRRGASDSNLDLLRRASETVRCLEQSSYNPREFRKRTATEIIKSGYSTGCTDDALVFLSLARKLGISSRYVETLKEDWLENPSFSVEGHVFADVFCNERFHAIDPFTCEFINGNSTDELYFLNKERYRVIGRGLDFSHLYLLENGRYRKEPVCLDTSEKIRQAGLNFGRKV